MSTPRKATRELSTLSTRVVGCRQSDAHSPSAWWSQQKIFQAKMSASTLKIDSFCYLSPWCTEDRKHRENTVTTFYDFGNGMDIPWEERCFRATFFGPSSPSPFENDFYCPLKDVDSWDIKIFADCLGVTSRSLTFGENIKWSWDNNAQVLTISSQADGGQQITHLPLNRTGIMVFRKIFGTLSQTHEQYF